MGLALDKLLFAGGVRDCHNTEDKYKKTWNKDLVAFQSPIDIEQRKVPWIDASKMVISTVSIRANRSDDSETLQHILDINHVR